jgi:Protein of unknown function (DUF1344)
MEVQSMGAFTMLAAILVAASLTFVTEARAQTQATPPAEQRSPGAGQQTPTPGEEKEVEGQVKSINPSGTEITLTDGTTLTTPPRTAVRPGALVEGAIVIASYREENGKKVLTGLALKEPTSEAPKN